MLIVYSRITRAADLCRGYLDRVLLSVRNLDSVAQSEENNPGSKILIWVGPGWPMLDSSRFQPSSSKGQEQLFNSIVELSTSLREANIALYSISMGQAGSGTFLYEDFLKGVKSAQKASPSNLGLKVLAVQSGGASCLPATTWPRRSTVVSRMQTPFIRSRSILHARIRGMSITT